MNDVTADLKLNAKTMMPNIHLIRSFMLEVVL